MNEPKPHPASRYGADPDGILLKYGPEAVMEHYYCDHTKTSQEWTPWPGTIIRSITKEWTKEEILDELEKRHAILKSQQDAREGRAGLI